MNFTVLNNRLTMYMMTMKPGMKTRKKGAFKVYDYMPAASCQFLILPPRHLWSSGFSSSPEGLPFLHTTRDCIKDTVLRVSDVLLAYDVFPVILYRQNVRPSGVLFSKETVCEKFQIAREEVMVTVTTTLKSGGLVMSPPSHRKFRLCV